MLLKCLAYSQRATVAGVLITIPRKRIDTDLISGADLGGVTRVTSHPSGAADYFMLLLCYNLCIKAIYTFLISPHPNSQMLKFHSPVSPDPLNARSLRSLWFSKSPPSKKS